MMLDNIDHYSAQIAVLDERIAVLCEPYERQVAQLDAIPGFGVTNAQDLIAEIGVDMTAFPSAGRLCSWARVAPRVKESGGKRKGRSATGRGSPYIGGTLGEAAASTTTPASEPIARPSQQNTPMNPWPAHCTRRLPHPVTPAAPSAASAFGMRGQANHVYPLWSISYLCMIST
jgi:transposase